MIFVHDSFSFKLCIIVIILIVVYLNTELVPVVLSSCVGSYSRWWSTKSFLVLVIFQESAFQDFDSLNCVREDPDI